LSKLNPLVEGRWMYKVDRKRFSFAHRRNHDGTFGSICPRCFRTIAQSASEPDLQNAEDSHVCNPRIVEYYRGLSKAVSDYREKSKGHAQGYSQMRELRPV
jgi:hypothetical protein